MALFVQLVTPTAPGAIVVPFRARFGAAVQANNAAWAFPPTFWECHAWLHAIRVECFVAAVAEHHRFWVAGRAAQFARFAFRALPPEPEGRRDGIASFLAQSAFGMEFVRTRDAIQQVLRVCFSVAAFNVSAFQLWQQPGCYRTLRLVAVDGCPSVACHVRDVIGAEALPVCQQR